MGEEFKKSDLYTNELLLDRLGISFGDGNEVDLPDEADDERDDEGWQEDEQDGRNDD